MSQEELISHFIDAMEIDDAQKADTVSNQILGLDDMNLNYEWAEYIKNFLLDYISGNYSRDIMSILLKNSYIKYELRDILKYFKNKFAQEGDLENLELIEMDDKKFNEKYIRKEFFENNRDIVIDDNIYSQLLKRIKKKSSKDYIKHAIYKNQTNIVDYYYQYIDDNVKHDHILLAIIYGCQRVFDWCDQKNIYIHSDIADAIEFLIVFGDLDDIKSLVNYLNSESKKEYGEGYYDIDVPRIYFCLVFCVVYNREDIFNFFVDLISDTTDPIFKTDFICISDEMITEKKRIRPEFDFKENVDLKNIGTFVFFDEVDKYIKDNDSEYEPEVENLVTAAIKFSTLNMTKKIQEKFQFYISTDTYYNRKTMNKLMKNPNINSDYVDYMINLGFHITHRNYYKLIKYKNYEMFYYLSKIDSEFDPYYGGNVYLSMAITHIDNQEPDELVTFLLKNYYPKIIGALCDPNPN